MLDDQAMDKKPTARSSLQGAKGGSAESKFKQDATSKFSRAPRRRESPSQRSEPPRRSNPQKNKTSAIDKRPRPRGTINLGDRSEVVENDFLEANATTKPGSRKVNLNHLLNFTFASRENASDFSGGHGARAKVKLPRFNKEQFLQANCQFVVFEGGDYTVHSADPDILVDWALIEQVRLPCHEVPSCPICLYPATAAKITRCGHIYCWTCVLHYLSLSDRSWSKCPICYEAIHQDDLKSVVSMACQAPKVGDQLQLSLIRRERGSQFVVPVTQWKGPPLKPLNISDDSAITSFQKLLVAKKADTLDILQREFVELHSQLLEADNPEKCFVEFALDLLQQRQHKFLTNSRPEAKTEDCLPDKLSPTLDIQNRNIDFEDSLPKIQDLVILEDKTELCCKEQRNISGGEEPILSASETLKQNASYHFYQASDGQQIYMHSINARMLIKEYGSLDMCPQQITADVIELETVTMTEALRKRLRYLQHLPLTCVFQVAELHLQPPLISPCTINFFNAEVQKRYRARSRKAREERRRERHIELEENKKLGKYPSARYSLTSLKQFPICNSLSTDEDPPLCPDGLRSPSPALASTPELDQDDASSVGSTDSRHASFAQMLRQGKARMERSTIQEASAVEMKEAKATLAINSDGEECAPAPEFHVTFGDAIQAAITNLALRNSESPDEKKNGKRKKGKKTLLFTTSMSRSK